MKLEVITWFSAKNEWVQKLLCRLVSFLRRLADEVFVSPVVKVRREIGRLGGKVIAGLEKGLEAGRLQAPPKHIVDGIDISKIAGYVGMSASVVKNRITLELMLVVQGGLLIAMIFYALDLNKQLKMKHYLMVPSQINGITEVAPQSLPESQVQKAFVYYLGLIGNIDSTNIKEHYSMMKDYMSKSLRIQFDMETKPFIEHVLTEGLSEYIKIGAKKIEAIQKGQFRAIAPITVYGAIRGRKTKPRKQYVVMKLKIVAPSDHNSWALQIEDLKRVSADMFDTQKRLNKPRRK